MMSQLQIKSFYVNSFDFALKLKWMIVFYLKVTMSGKKPDTVQLSKFILNATKEGEVWWVAHDCSANQNWLPI